MLTLRPYPEYRGTDVQWLANIPAHWGLVKTKYLFSERVQKGFPDEPLLAATQTKGVVPKALYESRTVVAQKDLHLLKLVKPGDFVISLRSFQGGIEYAQYRGIISPAYTVLSPRDGADPAYFRWLLKCHPFVDILSTFVTGIREGQNIDYERFARSFLLVPPPEEQAQIAAFLSHFDRRISRLIRAKRRMIELLEEQKQAIIHRAVTRGLDPDVRLKPSGVQWLGDIPEHWETWQIGHLARVGNGSTPSRSNTAYWSGGNYPWLNSSCVNRQIVESADQFVSDLALRECHLPRVARGSVLVAITGQGKTRGKATLLNMEATINQHIAFVTLQTKRLSPKYLVLCLTAAYDELRAISDASGSTKGALTCGDVRHFRLPLPPPEEQRMLQLAVERETADMVGAADRSRHEIDLLREYRTRLVADVVTGKLDVRGVELPETDDGEWPDELGSDDDIESEEADNTRGDHDEPV